jgi:hypothetical protein
LVKQPLPAALDTGAGGAGAGIGTRSGTQGALKGEKKKRRTYLPTFFRDFLRFPGLILGTTYMVFLSSSCRETAETRLKQSKEKKRQDFFFSQLFSQKAFDMDSPKSFVCF